LKEGRRRIVSFFDKVDVVTVGRGISAGFDPGFRSFSNINTPDDYYALRLAEHEARERIVFNRQVSR